MDEINPVEAGTTWPDPGANTQQASHLNAAAVTFVYNEGVVNLPVWYRYYAAQIGAENLYVIDDGSDDGSTDALPNVLRLPRGEFDDISRAAFVSNFVAALLSRYSVVIYGDCDELVVPLYQELGTYLDLQFDVMTCLGLNVVHDLLHEYPLDLSQPILAQRRYALFRSDTCKPAVTRVPVRWAPGFHACDREPVIDPQLFLIHTSRMDYGIAAARHQVTTQVRFSERTIGMGAHWRYETERFYREGFLDPMNMIKAGAQPFTFTDEIAQIYHRMAPRDGVWTTPMDLMKLVEMPPLLRKAF